MAFPRLVFLLFFASCINADDSAPKTRLGRDAHPSQSLVVYANLSLGEFLQAFTSESDTERQRAQMYLVGVLDTTEGRDWCGYDVILPGSASSIVIMKAKVLVTSRGSERAGTVLREILAGDSPCRSKK